MRRLIALAFCLLAVAGCGATGATTPPPSKHSSVASAHPSPARPVSHFLVGVYEPNDPGSYGEVQQWANNVGYEPGLVVYYSKWGVPFASTFCNEVEQHGGEPVIQIDPGVDLQTIVNGDWDGYLKSFAAQVIAFGHPVVISFGQEMNGNWYSWGYGHTSAATFVAAWQHVWTVFHNAGATNVTWMWNPNIDYPANAQYPNGPPLAEWWPGSQYVDWVGIDGYFFVAADSFDSRYDPTMSEIRQFTDAPILIAETAMGQVAGQATHIPELFAGVAADHLLGFIWFDQPQTCACLWHQDWRLEDNPAGLAVFQQQMKLYNGG